LFLLKDDQILLLRRFNTGYGDGQYSVIAGHLDGGEDVYSAMVREAKEEAGIDIQCGNHEIAHCMHRQTENDERVDWFFVCREWYGEITNMEPNKCDELRWVDINTLPDNMVDYVREAICNYKDEVKFSIYGWQK